MWWVVILVAGAIFGTAAALDSTYNDFDDDDDDECYGDYHEKRTKKNK